MPTTPSTDKRIDKAREQFYKVYPFPGENLAKVDFVKAITDNLPPAQLQVQAVLEKERKFADKYALPPSGRKADERLIPLSVVHNFFDSIEKSLPSTESVKSKVEEIEKPQSVEAMIDYYQGTLDRNKKIWDGPIKPMAKILIEEFIEKLRSLGSVEVKEVEIEGGCKRCHGECLPGNVFCGLTCANIYAKRKTKWK